MYTRTGVRLSCVLAFAYPRGRSWSLWTFEAGARDLHRWCLSVERAFPFTTLNGQRQRKPTRHMPQCNGHAMYSVDT